MNVYSSVIRLFFTTTKSWPETTAGASGGDSAQEIRATSPRAVGSAVTANVRPAEGPTSARIASMTDSEISDDDLVHPW
ncbi:hypothetical protein [Rhodococcus sp. 06-1460-1B]|uniref:hypothetical protein n=1 Tax=Rhodococcus sp. 06-1460-1B TaxID=2022501 RepID=UPI000B9AC0EE|nr:hypothetical protein [Rhodococcus sp. 06-1460-1B]OZD57443.1 hypothetical protein CH268_20405 [Rhodococcus sp. 06-1460-1B]